MAGNTNSSQRSMSHLPVILEEDTLLSPPCHTPLQRIPGAMFVHAMSDDDDDAIPTLNTNSNRHSELNNNSDDSAGSDNEDEKLRSAYGPKNMDMGEIKVAPLEEIPETDETVLKAPSWDTMLAQLNKLPGDAILLLADVRAVMLSQSHWNFPYPEALGHVLLAWQMLRSGCFLKDCRVWMRKKYQDKPFKQQPFTAIFGIAGFCIRRKRKAPDMDGLDEEHREERLQNNLIEYTGYSGIKGRKIIRRINSKKDERTERYKGSEWQDLDKVVVRWDNSGYHTSGSVQVTFPEYDLDSCGTLRRHSSLPSNSQPHHQPEETAVFTVAHCLKPGQKNFSPPNKRIKRHNSDSSLCPGKKSQMWMDYSSRRLSSDLAADKTSSEDLTKEELWNRAMAEVHCQNLTSSNNSETIGMVQVKEEVERALSPAGSVTSADWSVGSGQSSDSCVENCNCSQCGRRSGPTPLGFYSTHDLLTPSEQDDSSIPEIIETADDLVDDVTQPSEDAMEIQPALVQTRSGNEMIVSKMKNSLTLSELSLSNQARSTESELEFVNVRGDRVPLQLDENSGGSGDSIDGDYVKCKVGSDTSVGFAPSDRDLLHSDSDRLDM